MKLRLVKASYDNKDEITEMIHEWRDDIEANHTYHSPRAIFRNDVDDFAFFLEKLERKKEEDGKVPNSVFFCIDEDRNRYVGAVDIRHYLNDDNILSAGHIADGIRPTERRKGYATAMIGLALDECRKLGLNKVLMTCDVHNIGSAKSIMNNGGIFESEIEDDGDIEKRFWLNLYEETIDTERLTMRRVMPMDYPEMTWLQDARVQKYLLGQPLKDLKDAMNFLRMNDPNSKTAYRMIIHSKADGHAVGIISATYVPEDSAFEISYSICYDDWGHGYTAEAGKALMDHVTEQFGQVNFKSECAKENTQSARVMEKLGLIYDHDSSYTKRDGSKTYESSVYFKRI